MLEVHFTILVSNGTKTPLAIQLKMPSLKYLEIILFPVIDV